jgi:hypothetical protein
MSAMKLLLNIFLLAWIPFATAKAANLYQIELPAETQTDTVRAQLMREGLVQVLEQVSGNKRIQKNPFVKTKLNHADRFVQEYRYVLTKGDMPETKYVMHLHYNQSAVLALLKKAGALKKTSQPATALTLQISPITKSEQVQTVLAQFSRMENVQKVELAQITGDEVKLALSVRGSMDTFQQQIAKYSAENKLFYEWSR